MSADVFISHSTSDREVANAICKQLETDGLKCWIAPRDIEGGDAWDEAIMKGIAQAGVLLLTFSEGSTDSEYVKKEIMYAQSKKKPLLPVRIQNVQPSPKLEFMLVGIQWVDAFPLPITSYTPELTKLVRRILSLSPNPAPAPPTPQGGTSPALPATTPGTPVASPRPGAGAGKQVALLYKRNSEPDEHVLSVLERSLADAGYQVVVDRNMQIERNIRDADVVIPLLSEASKDSDMLSYEVEVANDAARSGQGKPKLIPLRIAYQGPLGGSLHSILSALPSVVWNGQGDDASMVSQLLAAMQKRQQMDQDGAKEPIGAIPPGSKFYIARPSDDALNQALSRQDSIVLVKGGRQMGKTSLLARGLQQARNSGLTAVYTDLQKLDSANLAGIKPFYFSLARMLADTLDIDTDIEQTWRDFKPASVNFEQYLKKQVIAKVNGHLFWALDEVDRLFTTDFGSDVFGLFRSWHNERATDPETAVNRLTLIISYATEAHLFIADPNQSPFNVGTKLELRDFTVEQEEVLNQLFGAPLSSDDQIARFNALVNGQPYLTKRGLHDLAMTQMPFEEFIKISGLDEGPFGDHLRRILVMLSRDQTMSDAVRSVLNGANDLTMEAFYRLRAAGIVVGDSVGNVRMRNLLYTEYLRNHLTVPA